MSKNSVQKHCSVCAKAGMPPEVFTTHFVRETRDISSRVTCPLLKNNICSKCGLKGHFAGSCKVVKREKKQVSTIQVAKVSSKNMFDFGSESDESDEETEAEITLPPKSEKDVSSILTLAHWQTENKGLLLQSVDVRNTAKYYWDEKFELFCANGYVIVEKEVLCLGKAQTIKVIKPIKSSWADDDDEDF